MSHVNEGNMVTWAFNDIPEADSDVERSSSLKRPSPVTHGSTVSCLPKPSNMIPLGQFLPPSNSGDRRQKEMSARRDRKRLPVEESDDGEFRRGQTGYRY
jgi:hypothetical protein